MLTVSKHKIAAVLYVAAVAYVLNTKLDKAAFQEAVDMMLFCLPGILFPELIVAITSWGFKGASAKGLNSSFTPGLVAFFWWLLLIALSLFFLTGGSFD